MIHLNDMKYKLKIVPQDGGYVGYALLNDEVVYTTNNHKDTVMASRELSSYVASASQEPAIPTQKSASVRSSAVQAPSVNNLVPARRSSTPAPVPSPTPIQGVARPSAAPVRRCCGRG